MGTGTAPNARNIPAQLDAVERYNRGQGVRKIASILQISPTAVRDRLEAAPVVNIIVPSRFQVPPP